MARAGEPALVPAPQADDPPRAVAVTPAAKDGQIAARLERVLQASGWFEAPQVRVDEGIVFLSGRAADDSRRDWAGQLARSTQDVLAVVNHMEVAPRPLWELAPALDTLQRFAGQAIRALPVFAFALALLTLTWLLARRTRGMAAMLLGRRIRSTMMTEVLARALALPVLLLGLYVVLRISGLTGLALSLLGGTGLVGLIIGFAFRDIAENFLASLLISTQRPFATGDLIEVAGHRGFVQRVNTRVTLLMTLEGNHVQIPNATIYKAAITNFTANPNERLDFGVGIGYGDSISRAQSVALEVLRGHEAVLGEPEPLVLVEALGAATVNLRVYFWVDITVHSGPKVKSSVIRLIKRAFDSAGISMPDEAREVVFPEGVPVLQRPGAGSGAIPGPAAPPRPVPPPDEPEAHSAEGGLASQAPEIERQARHARSPEGGQNLLDD